MTNLPLVSVLLPVHNAGRTLLPAVGSILDQSLRDLELLVLDDASTDNALDALNRIEDPRLRVVRDPVHRGLAGRLNCGIDLARGRYLARMDQDDIAFRERLRKQIEFLEAHREVDLLGTRALAVTDKGEALGLLPFQQDHESICRRPWLGFPLAHPTWAGRAEWYRRYRYRVPEPKRAEDQDLLLRSYASSKFACLPEVLLGYRISAMGLRKRLTARMNVGKAQLRTHLRGARPAFALLGAGAAMAKAGVDTALALAGRTTYSARGLERPVAPEVLAEWRQLWRHAAAWAPGADKVA